MNDNLLNKIQTNALTSARRGLSAAMTGLCALRDLPAAALSNDMRTEVMRAIMALDKIRTDLERKGVL